MKGKINEANTKFNLADLTNSHRFKDIEFSDIWMNSPLKQPERICLSIKLSGGVCCQVFWGRTEGGCFVVSSSNTQQDLPLELQ